MGGSTSCTHPLHAEESERKLFTVFTSTVPHQTKANTTGGPSSREETREAVSVCVCIGGGGVCACEHTNALRSRVWLQPKRTVYKVQIKNNREDPPPGAQATSGFVLSLSFPDILADDARSPHSCAWIQGNPLKDFCDLRGLHHSFLEEGFCLCERQKCLWRSAQTLVPRGSLGGEAILLVCWERLQAIHQGPR